MKIKNSIKGYGNHFFRKAISWVCRQHDLKVSHIRSVTFKKAVNRWSGEAYSRDVVIRWNPENYGYPHSHTYSNRGVENGYPLITLNDSIEALVMLLAHELWHVVQMRDGYYRKSGHTHADAEKNAEQHTNRVLNAFRPVRDELLQQWGRVTVKVAACKSVSVVDKRAEKAEADLARWQRKLKLAKSKVSKYAARVRYYQRKKAN